jgi:hypothetical protein
MSLEVHARSILKRIAVGRWCAKLPGLRLAYRFASALVPYAGNNLPGSRHAQRGAFDRWMESLKVHAGAKPVDFNGGCSPTTAWSAARGSYSASLVNNALHLRRLESISKRVFTASPAWDEMLATPGGVLVLTMHHDFHHTLFAMAGRAGRRVRVIAAPEESSPLAAWLGEAIHAMHRACAHHFNGGDYLFMAPGAPGAGAAVAHALRRGEMVFSLHDFAAPEGMRSLPAELFGKQFEAPSGALELATRMKIPVYFAALVWQPVADGYHLEAHRLAPDSENPVKAYTEAVQGTIKQWPWAWSGWQWFDDLGR